MTDTFTVNSLERLVGSTENTGLQVMCSVRIGLEKQMCKAGDGSESQAAFLFLKIVIKTDICHFTVKLTRFSGIFLARKFLKDGSTLWVTHPVQDSGSWSVLLY